MRRKRIVALPRSVWSKRDPRLLPSLVCFADILGFSELTRSAIKQGQGDEFVRRLTSTLGGVYRHMRERQTPSRPFEMKVFTDNIVVAFPLAQPDWDKGESELMMMFQIFSELQCKLAVDGFFIRGGIAYGTHYMDGDVAVGDALLEAVEFGDKHGGPPRLVIAPSVETLLAQYARWYGSGEPPHLRELLEDGNDSKLFLNYLNQAFWFFPDSGMSIDLIVQHAAAVRQNLDTSRGDKNVAPKYEWAAAYHNFVCEDFALRHPLPYGEDADELDVAAAEEAQMLTHHLLSPQPPLRSAPPRHVSPARLD